MHILLHTLEHSLIDSIKVLPFIFIVYLIIEYFEHKNNTDLSHMLMKTNRFGSVFGGLLGSIPQCGFSVIASDLFSKKAISMGTLIAIFIATSDEAVPILLSDVKTAPVVISVIPVKIIIAIGAGFITDLLFKHKKKEHICETEEHHDHFHGNCENCDDGILKSSLIHTVKIFIFIFIATFILGYIIEYFGEDRLSGLLLKDSFLQPFIASFIGLIPNCAASVILTQSYISGVLSFGSLISGLCSGAGIGLLILFKRNSNIKDNLKILTILYLTGSIAGFIIHII